MDEDERPAQPVQRTALALRAVVGHGAVCRADRGAGVESFPRLDVSIAVQVGHFFPVGAIVAQSDLVATVPWGMARTMSTMVPLRIFKPPVELPLSHLSVVWHERYHRDPGNRWFREMFIRETRALYEHNR